MSSSCGNEVDGSRPVPYDTGAVAFVVILAVPTLYYLSIFKNLFETCLNITISLDTSISETLPEENIFSHPEAQLLLI